MAFVTTIENDEHQAIASLASAHHRYQFADGSFMFVDTTPAWCPACRTFVMVEQLGDPAAMESDIRDHCANRDRCLLLVDDPVRRGQQRDMNRAMLAHFLHAAAQWREAL